MEKNNWFSEGLIIAGITLLGYLYSYIYYAGNFRMFNIPYDLINITPTTIFIVALVMVIMLYAIIHISSLVFTILPGMDNSSPLARSLARFFIPMIFLIGLVVIYGKDWERYAYYFAGIALVAIFEFIFPIFSQWGKGTYQDKLLAQEQHEKTIRFPIVDDIHKSVGHSNWLLFIYFVISLALVYNAGVASAQKQKEFLVIDETNQVVLNMSGDRYIVSSFNENKELDNSFLILNESNLANKKLSVKKVGPFNFTKLNIK